MSPSATWRIIWRKTRGNGMEQTQRSSEYVFQGTMYFFRREKIYCRYQFTLRDTVDPVLLQQALDAALSAADYYRVQLVWEGKKAYLAPNDAPCTVHLGAQMPQIPDETGGYLFSVGCAGATVYFDWYHFLMDGRGVSPFLTMILEQYCNLRYGTAFALRTLQSSPAYDIAALVQQYPEEGDIKSNLQRDVLQTCEGELHRTRVRLTKQSLVVLAAQCGVKPFCALAGLLCLALHRYFGKDEIQWSYSVDARDAVGVPDALYNCVCSYQHKAAVGDDTCLKDFVAELDAQVRHDLQPDTMRQRMALQMGWVYKVDSQKAPLKIKQRIFQMGEYISGVPADFWLSYLGNPLLPATPELQAYTADFGVWVPPDGGSMGVEASSLNGIVTLCINNKAAQAGLGSAIRTAFEREGIDVLEACECEPE